MASTASGAVLFVRDVARMASFYGGVAGLRASHDEPGLVVLESAAGELVIHALRNAAQATGDQGEAREDAYVKLFFAVASLGEARARAAALGGSLAPASDDWTARGFRASEGVDPEGNVFQLREPLVPPTPTPRATTSVGRVGRFLGGLSLVLLAFALLAGAFVAMQPNALYAWRLMRAPRPAMLPVPVEGISARRLVDTWNAPRGGGRQHQGIDIFAPKGTPVVSPVDGLVLSVGPNTLGGNTVKVLGPGAQVHYFAHLDRYGDVRADLRVRRGTTLGYVGVTGNARGTPPHLHYGVYAVPGGAENPYPLLTRFLRR